MTRHSLPVRLTMAGAIFLLTIAGVPASAQDRGPVTDIPAELQQALRDSHIFIFADTVSGVEAPGRAASLVARNGGVLDHVYTTAIRGFSARMPAAAAARMAANNPEIAFYEVDAIARAIGSPDAAGSPGSVEAQTSPQVVPSGIVRVGGPVDGTGLRAWIIDSGIDLDHPDLNVDTALSANFARGRGANDGNGHGTHVAGTVAAIDNTIDVVGVASGATLVAVRVLGRSGTGTYSGVIAGIDYVAANAAPGDVANMSLGGPASDALDLAVIGAAERGTLFSLAAGNSGQDANFSSPARAEHPNIYTVSAVDSADFFASFSNYGNPPVDYAAPGVNVLSTLIGGGVLNLSGTSMAAPHVAGVLLATGGMPRSDGCAVNDPDGVADPIVSIVSGSAC